MGQAVAFQIKSFTFAGKHIYQDIRMKKVFKLAGGFMVGACIGFVGIIGVRVLVLGDLSYPDIGRHIYKLINVLL
ncbi:hypothetical protein DWW30_20380, partial [Bacteroides sp. AF15-14LB]